MLQLFENLESEGANKCKLLFYIFTVQNIFMEHDLYLIS